MVTTRYIGERYTAGVGYLIVPNDLDRDTYVRYCFNTNTISIALENGGILNNVQCTKSVIQQLEFPLTSKEIGNQVVWVDQEALGYPVIVGVLLRADQVTDLSEHQTSHRRVTENGSSEILVDGKNPFIIINSDSLKDSGGDIYIVSKNTGQTSKININSSGEINLSSQNIQASISNELNVVIRDSLQDDKITTINYTKGKGFNYLDECDNQIEVIDGKINIVSDNINIGGDNASESILLGDTTVSMIDKILEILGRTQTTTLIGPQPLLTAAEFTALRAQLETLKSKKHRIE